jgi:hypothetical protein
MKMLVEYDVEKIEREEKYDLQEIDEIVNEVFSMNGLHKNEDGFYVGGDFVEFGAVILYLTEKKWFMDNIKVWKWYQSDEAETDDEYYEDDVLADFRDGD